MTDHANLQYWKSPKNLNRRTARWHADLQEYDYEILYVPGKTNTPPDALSRPPGADKGEANNKDITVLPKDKFITASTIIAPEGKIVVVMAAYNIFGFQSCALKVTCTVTCFITWSVT